MRWLEEKHAIVTGGSGGIGSAAARALSAAGARVTLLGRNLEALERIAAGLGGSASLVLCDVTVPEEVNSAFQHILRTRGLVHILVNAAGAAVTEPFLKTSLEVWNRLMGVNLTSAFLCSRAAIPSMLEAGWGRIVNIASTAGLKAYPYASAYVAAKHGLVGFTKALALEFARSNITVNAICPSFTETRLLQESIAKVAGRTGRSEEEVRAEFAKYNPQGRFVTPEEVAQAVLFLCGPASEAINGHALSISGGEV
ncbi:SDR family NAD(P)-dependent oxidoreductase [uncultured Thermus sp.]|uniref:SDR family NAD(P)-dependent oxidoreductase n=1 Tax=uncultured Thermus sp. TaxID=157149 RepID=UPI00262E77CC|nr:SDR family NAD(P)-dependent oxidoreductase [uncultured Thermus sp.]